MVIHRHKIYRKKAFSKNLMKRNTFSTYLILRAISEGRCDVLPHLGLSFNPSILLLCYICQANMKPKAYFYGVPVLHEQVLLLHQLLLRVSNNLSFILRLDSLLYSSANSLLQSNKSSNMMQQIAFSICNIIQDSQN